MRAMWARLDPFARRAGLLGALALVLVAAVTSCARRGSDGERLPGHSRPIVAHGWPHPRDYRFGPSTFAAPDPATALVTTTSGVRAYVLADAGDRLVRVTVAFPSGRLREKLDEAGASEALIDALTRRGPAGSPRPLSLRLDALGLAGDWFQGSSNPMVRAFSGEEAGGAAPPEVRQLLDVGGLSLEVLPEDWEDALALLVDMVRHPAIESAPAGPGYSTLAGIGSTSFRPAVELERLLQGYPLAPPAPGSTLAAAAAARFVARTLAADRVVFGVGGAVERSAVSAALEKLTAGWPRAGEPLHLEPLPDTTVAGQLKLVDAPTLQASFAIGRAIAGVADGDEAAVAVAADLLDTRLNIATREIRGLANRDTFMTPETANRAGLVQARSSARPESIAALVKLTLAEIGRLGGPESGIGDEELQRAKGALVLGRWQGAYGGAAVSSATLAFEHAQRGAAPRPGDWPRDVAGVTAEKVREVASRYFRPDSMTVVVVGPLDEVRRARHPRWPESLDGIRGEPAQSGSKQVRTNGGRR